MDAFGAKKKENPMSFKKILLCVFVLLSTKLFADEKSTYIQLLQNNKMDELKTHLEKWEKNKPNDPEMFIGYFNYYLSMASSDKIIFGGNNPPKNGTYMTINDQKTGEKIGYLYGEVTYDRSYAEKALQVINNGLELFPNRLDMHFGKTRLLANLQAYNEQKNYLLKVFNIGSKINNKWLWSDSKNLEEPEEVFISSVHDYVSEWLNSDNKVAFECSKPICEVMIKYFPKSIYGYNDCGIFYAISGDLVNAEKYFLGGYQVDSDDDVVIGNLAYLYESKNDKNNAIKYYTLLTKSKDKSTQNYANKKLASLGK